MSLRTVRLLVLAGAAVLFLWQLGSHDLWAPDEPYFAEGAREMVVDGHWAAPHVNGTLSTDKPPLFFWSIAVLSLPLGEVTSWTARLPSALAALGTLLLVLRMGERFFGPRTAALAVGVLATTHLFWDKARWSQTDALLCFLIWTALTAFERLRAGDWPGRRAGLVFWGFAALAILDKGPVGLFLPLGIALVVLAVDGVPRRGTELFDRWGLTLFAAIVGGWMVFATLGSGGEYSVWGALREHVIDRGIHGLHHEQPFWYFFEALPPSLLPWTALVPGALVLAWRRRSPADRFLLAVFLFVLIFFSISTEKRQLYALPAVPAVALMVAGLVARVCSWNEEPSGCREGVSVDRRWVLVAQGFLGAVFAAAAAAIPFVAPRFPELPRISAHLLAAGLAATGLSALLAALVRRPLAATVAPGLGISLVYLLAVSHVYPRMEPRKSGRFLAEEIRARTAGEDVEGRILAYELGNVPETLAFYGDGLTTIETNDPAELVRHLRREEKVWAVVDGSKLEEVPEGLHGPDCVLHETELARRPILVLTNRCGGSQPPASSPSVGSASDPPSPETRLPHENIAEP